ncbi:MAG: hypothetical protein V4623_09790 [Pseudomonadota bacterium]
MLLTEPMRYRPFLCVISFALLPMLALAQQAVFDPSAPEQQRQQERERVLRQSQERNSECA